jgi:NitT/TauT family transport system permease protein
MMRVWLLRILIVGGFLLAWQLGSGSVIPEFFVSKPSIIIAKFWLWVVNGSLFFHAGITVVEALAGFLLGGLAGLSIGMLLGRNELLGKVFDPIIVVFYSIPKVALAPLFVIWLGIGIEMKIVLTGTIVFFLVFLSTYTGVRNVSRELVAIMKLMGATESQVVFKLVLPSAVTWVFAGLRLSVPYALIGAVVGELIAANRGLGYLLSNAAGQFDTAGVFAALIGLIILAILLNMAVRAFENLVLPWQKETQKREMSI